MKIFNRFFVICCILWSDTMLTMMTRYIRPLPSPGSSPTDVKNTGTPRPTRHSSSTALVIPYTPPVSLQGAKGHQISIAVKESQLTPSGGSAMYNIKRQNAPITNYVGALQPKYPHVPESILLADIIVGTESIKYTGLFGITHKNPILGHENFDRDLTATTQREDDAGTLQTKPSLTPGQQLHLALPAINAAYGRIKSLESTCSNKSQLASLTAALVEKYPDIEPELLQTYVDIVLTQHPKGQSTWAGWGTPTAWTADNIMDAPLSGDFAELGKGIVALNRVHHSDALKPYVQYESNLNLSDESAPESKSGSVPSLSLFELMFGKNKFGAAAPAIDPSPSGNLSMTETKDERTIISRPASLSKTAGLDLSKSSTDTKRDTASHNGESKSLKPAAAPKPTDKQQKGADEPADTAEVKNDENLDFDTKKSEPKPSWLKQKFESISDLSDKIDELKKEQDDDSTTPERKKEIKKELKNLKFKEKIMNALKGFAVAGALSGLGTLSKELDDMEKNKKDKKKKSNEDDDFADDLFTDDDDDFAETKEKPSKKEDRQETKQDEPKKSEPQPERQQESELEQFFNKIEPLSPQGHMISAKITTHATLPSFINSITIDIFEALQITTLLPESLLMTIETDPNFIDIKANARATATNEWLQYRFNEERFEDWLQNYQLALVNYIVEIVKHKPAQNYVTY